MPKTLLLDPGHGGYDSGAVDPNLSAVEKEMNLQIATALKVKLEAYQIPVLMTRDTDVCPAGEAVADVNQDLAARVKIAEDHNVDLFLSIHNNAGGGTGSEIYVFQGGGEVASLAHQMVESVGSLMGIHGEPVKDGSGLYVIRNTSMPSMLLEVGFVDNAQDVDKIKANIDKIADLIAAPLIPWLGGIAPAPAATPKEADPIPPLVEPAQGSETLGVYEEYVQFVKQNNLMHDKGPNVFGVSDPVTRGDLAVVVTRLHELLTTGKVTK